MTRSPLIEIVDHFQIPFAGEIDRMILCRLVSGILLWMLVLTRLDFQMFMEGTCSCWMLIARMKVFRTGGFGGEFMFDNFFVRISRDLLAFHRIFNYENLYRKKGRRESQKISMPNLSMKILLHRVTENFYWASDILHQLFGIFRILKEVSVF